MTIKMKIKIKNRSGLHARPAAIFVSTCKKYRSTIKIQKHGKIADAKNMLQILALGIDYGDEITLIIDGDDENTAYRDLKDLLEKHLPAIDK